MRWVIALTLSMFVAATAHADWNVRRDPFDPVVVRRYKEILVRNPHDEVILRALLGLYQRYRTVAKLEAEYRVRLEAGEDWAALIVLARLPRSSHTESVALWKRALAANPADATGWQAAGDAATGDPAAARDLYRHAARLMTEPRRKRLALTKLIGAAGLVGDVATVDHAYEELIGLAPKDGELWFERGNAQLTAKRFDAAVVSYATAEPLLRRSPEHRLSAMMNRGIALEGLGQFDAAVAQFERVLDNTPRGYYLGQELALRIADADRRHGQVTIAIARLEKRWPERSRGYFEWATLADLYSETLDEDRALRAYERAVARAPTEVATQRKLIALLDKLHPDKALAAHEAAARVAPGDVELQIALARRYRADQPEKGFATLAALSRRMTGSVSAHTKIAELYEEWHELGRAIPEYVAIATLEPADPDHAIVLGEAYWRAGNRDKALAAWNRLDKPGTATSLYRHGEELAVHEVWDDAISAYTRSLALDRTQVDTWYGRARAHDALAHYVPAIEDARRAVALTGNASQSDGMRNRGLLVRMLGHAYAKGDRTLDTTLQHWRFALDHGDAIAGYLLAAHHARIRSQQLHAVLVELYRLVPTDDSLGISVARSFEHRGDFERARRELEQIGKRTPARAEEVHRLVARLDSDRERFERDFRWDEEGRSEGRSTRRPDIVGRDHRGGLRLELGGDVHDASGALFGFGLYITSRHGPGTALALRLDWTKRNDELEEPNTYALAGSVTRRILDTRKFELAAGIGPRLELRYHRGPTTAWNRGGLAGDLTLELLPRAIPATLGLRFDHNLTDHAKSSAVLLELGFEVR